MPASQRRMGRIRHDLALAKLGAMAYHLDSPAYSNYIPLGVSARTMQTLGETRMIDLDYFDQPFLGYVLTSEGLKQYCIRARREPRRYQVHVQRFRSTQIEPEILDMRQAYDRVAELMGDQYHNGILHAAYVSV